MLQIFDVPSFFSLPILSLELFFGKTWIGVILVSLQIVFLVFSWATQ